MESLVVECLRCGRTRTLDPSSPWRQAAPECQRCGYLGWAPTSALTEHDRRMIRVRPPEQRRLRLA